MIQRRISRILAYALACGLAMRWGLAIWQAILVVSIAVTACELTADLREEEA